MTAEYIAEKSSSLILLYWVFLNLYRFCSSNYRKK